MAFIRPFTQNLITLPVLFPDRSLNHTDRLTNLRYQIQTGTITQPGPIVCFQISIQFDQCIYIPGDIEIQIPNPILCFNHRTADSQLNSPVPDFTGIYRTWRIPGSRSQTDINDLIFSIPVIEIKISPNPVFKQAEFGTDLISRGNRGFDIRVLHPVVMPHRRQLSVFRRRIHFRNIIGTRRFTHLCKGGTQFPETQPLGLKPIAGNNRSRDTSVQITVFIFGQGRTPIVSQGKIQIIGIVPTGRYRPIHTSLLHAGFTVLSSRKSGRSTDIEKFIDNQSVPGKSTHRFIPVIPVFKEKSRIQSQLISEKLIGPSYTSLYLHINQTILTGWVTRCFSQQIHRDSRITVIIT